MNKNIHFVAHNPNGGWSCKKAGSTRASKTFEKQSDCIDYTRTVSKNQGTEMRIQGVNGKFRAADSHGNDPYPPKG